MPGEQADRQLMAIRHALVPWLYAVDGEFTQTARTGEYANRVAALESAHAKLRANDRRGALEALAVLYEGRQCARLSAEVYAFERAYWAGEHGWSSRFGLRAPPPLPAFDAACRALAGGHGDGATIAAGLEAARTESMQAAENAVALVAAKLRAATLQLREPQSGGSGKSTCLTGTPALCSATADLRTRQSPAAGCAPRPWPRPVGLAYRRLISPTPSANRRSPIQPTTNWRARRQCSSDRAEKMRIGASDLCILTSGTGTPPRGFSMRSAAM